MRVIDVAPTLMDFSSSFTFRDDCNVDKISLKTLYIWLRLVSYTI
jgi:hypothetical protein